MTRSIRTEESHGRRRLPILFLTLLIGSLVGGALAGEHRLLVGMEVITYGWLEVDAPGHWEVDGDSTYQFRSKRAEDFVMLITPMPFLEALSSDERCRATRSTVESTLRGLRAIAEESGIPIQEMKAPKNCAHYVSITDKTVTEPTAEDFKYGTQGAASVGHLMVSFTILTNTKDSPEVQAALALLASARHAGGPAEPAATAGAATRLSYPGKRWSVLVDLSGFELEAPALDDAGTGIRFKASSEEPMFIMSMFYEPADRGDDPKAYRTYYREASLAKGPLKREDIRETGSDEMPLLWYTNVAGEYRQHNVNAFMVRDGLWIDLHLSSMEPRERAHELFGRFLGSLRFVEAQEKD